MWLLHTVYNICLWYIAWLGFIVYGNNPDRALPILETAPLTPTLLAIAGIVSLFYTLRIAVADSIMVCVTSN
jgi:hypothetical protein